MPRSLPIDGLPRASLRAAWPAILHGSARAVAAAKAAHKGRTRRLLVGTSAFLGILLLLDALLVPADGVLRTPGVALAALVSFWATRRLLRSDGFLLLAAAAIGAFEILSALLLAPDGSLLPWLALLAFCILLMQALHRPAPPSAALALRQAGQDLPLLPGDEPVLFVPDRVLGGTGKGLRHAVLSNRDAEALLTQIGAPEDLEARLAQEPGATAYLHIPTIGAVLLRLSPDGSWTPVAARPA